MPKPLAPFELRRFGPFLIARGQQTAQDRGKGEQQHGGQHDADLRRGAQPIPLVFQRCTGGRIVDLLLAKQRAAQLVGVTTCIRFTLARRLAGTAFSVIRKISTRLSCASD